jgi:hypothetical protein
LYSRRWFARSTRSGDLRAWPARRICRFLASGHRTGEPRGERALPRRAAICERLSIAVLLVEAQGTRGLNDRERHPQTPTVIVAIPTGHTKQAVREQRRSGLRSRGVARDPAHGPRCAMSAAVREPPPETKEPRNPQGSPGSRVLPEWRDPDSNRGHHDFQAFLLTLQKMKIGRNSAAYLDRISWAHFAAFLGPLGHEMALRGPIDLAARRRVSERSAESALSVTGGPRSAICYFCVHDEGWDRGVATEPQRVPAAG